jgi:hypothetical protein
MTELQFPRPFSTGGGPAHWAQWAATQVVDGLPITPVTWFGPRDRDPKTASVDRCALAVAHPKITPRLDRRETALLEFAIRVATRPRVRVWDGDYERCRFDSTRDAALNWRAFGRGYMEVGLDENGAATSTLYGFRRSQVVRDMTYWAGRINPPLNPSAIFRGVMA